MCCQARVVLAVQALAKAPPERSKLNKEYSKVDVAVGRIRKEFGLIFVRDDVINDIHHVFQGLYDAGDHVSKEEVTKAHTTKGRNNNMIKRI